MCSYNRINGTYGSEYKKGYDVLRGEFAFDGAIISDWDAVRAADGPVPVPSAAPYVPGSFLSRIPTPSGKVQLVCPEMAQYGRAELSPLPRWSPPERDPEFPFTGMAGARIPFAIHSRCHKVPQLRRLRPQPLVELCPGDAAALGIAEGDHLSITSPAGSITMTAHLHDGLLPGEISLYHGYEGANANELIPADLLLIASGFSGCEKETLDAFGLAQTKSGCAASVGHATAVEKVFVAGDMRRGPSLVVWAIAEGREAAQAVDAYLLGYSNLL